MQFCISPLTQIEPTISDNLTMKNSFTPISPFIIKHQVIDNILSSAPNKIHRLQSLVVLLAEEGDDDDPS